MKRAVLAALLLAGCGHGPEIRLPDPIDDTFRKLTGHDGITLGETLTIYGTENPPSDRMQCHENQHREQARHISDAAVESGAIDDSTLERARYWILMYLLESADVAAAGGDKYRDNRFEFLAREMCK